MAAESDPAAGDSIFADSTSGLAAYGVAMASWADVRQIAMALPETTERSGREGLLDWRVGEKSFVWERPLRGPDIKALGPTAPEGPILGVRVPDLGVKDALLAEDAEVHFTTPHFDGYPAILVRLDRITVADLAELVIEAWLVRAPKRLAKDYLARQTEA